MFRRRRRERALSKVQPGDGSALKPYRSWHVLNRSLFFLDPRVPAEPVVGGEEPPSYAVDVDLFADTVTAHLYRDGRQEALSPLPAALPVPGGTIEVDATVFGLKRMHLIDDDGTEHQLRPHPRSAEGWRARLTRRFPRTSQVLGVLAVIILLVSLAIWLPQLVEFVTRISIVEDTLGWTFTSPITTPSWLDSGLAVAGVAAAVERALTLRNHWLIDADATLFGD